MMFCSECGSKLDDDARFCPVCGAKVSLSAAASAAAGKVAQGETGPAVAPETPSEAHPFAEAEAPAQPVVAADVGEAQPVPAAPAPVQPQPAPMPAPAPQPVPVPQPVPQPAPIPQAAPAPQPAPVAPAPQPAYQQPAPQPVPAPQPQYQPYAPQSQQAAYAQQPQTQPQQAQYAQQPQTQPQQAQYAQQPQSQPQQAQYAAPQQVPFQGQPAYTAAPQPLDTSRSLITYILLSIVTCSIYPVYFNYKLSKDIDQITNENETLDGPIFVLLWYVTCGIFGWYTLYKEADRMQKIAPAYGLQFQQGGAFVLGWVIGGSIVGLLILLFVPYFGSILGLLVMCIMYIGVNALITNGNALSAAYNARMFPQQGQQQVF